MEDEKMLMKKDLALILKIDKRMDYEDIDNVKKIHDALLEKQMFHTVLGTRYIKKLEQFIAGTSTNNCFFCGKTVSTPNRTVLCEDCLKKFVKSESQDTTVHETTQSTSPKNKEEKVVIPETNTQKKSSKKLFVLGIIAVVILISIISAIGVDKIFGVMTIIALIVLAYKFIKKKPKKATIIVLFILVILTSIFSNFSDNKSSSLKGYDDFQEFLRDSDNVGKTVTFNAEVVSVFNDKYLIQVRAKNSGNLIQIVTSPLDGLELFHGDSISYTGIYNGRTTDGNRIAFKTISIEIN